jgi:hypothetical protein
MPGRKPADRVVRCWSWCAWGGPGGVGGQGPGQLTATGRDPGSSPPRQEAKPARLPRQRLTGRQSPLHVPPASCLVPRCLMGALLVLNTLLVALAMVPPALLKLLLPASGLRMRMDQASQCPGVDLGGGQQCLDRRRVAAGLGRGGGRRAARPGLVPGVTQPPELGRHPGVAARVPRPHPVPEVLPEEGIDLGAGDRPGVVGAGLPVHGPRQGPWGAAQRPRDHPGVVPEVQAHSDDGHQLRRGDAPHAGQTRGAGKAPTVTCCAPRRVRLAWRWPPWASCSRPCST